MFKKLQQKWSVDGWRLFVILLCFAIAGSLTGYAGRRLMELLDVSSGLLWWIVYIPLITLLWPLFVVAVSIVFGQFPFFRDYLSRMGKRIAGTTKNRKTNGHPARIAVFASGSGSNAEQIIRYFNYPENNQTKHASVVLVVCNKPGAGVLDRAARLRMPVLMIEKEKFFRGNAYINELKTVKVDLIVLAGFLWKIPDLLISAFPNRIINIHPALLPKYGGKGMYGNHVHEAVIAAGEKESGITIHWVDGHYDNGDIIFQAKCPVFADDDAKTLAERVHQLEHRHYPTVVASILPLDSNKQ